MLPNHAQFIEAIRDRNKVRVEFYSKPDSGVVDRVCAPLYYGPDTSLHNGANLYWLWDFANSAQPNPLGLAPEQIVKLHVLGEVFDAEGLGLTSNQRKLHLQESPPPATIDASRKITPPAPLISTSTP